MQPKRATKDRKRILKIVGGRYTKHLWAFQQGKCIYCGDPATDVDHIPAITWLYALGSEHFKKFPIITVPACKRCNGWLSDKPFHTIRQRKGYIATRLRRIFDKVMSSPKWEDEEIEEMGAMFKTFLRNREDIRAFGLRKLEWAESTLPWDLDGQTTEYR